MPFSSSVCSPGAAGLIPILLLNNNNIIIIIICTSYSFESKKLAAQRWPQYAQKNEINRDKIAWRIWSDLEIATVADMIAT